MTESSAPSAVFLDVDGVLLDEGRTPAEWVRLIGDVLAPALGGEPLTAERNFVTLLLRAQCRIAGVPYPGDDAAFALGRRLDDYVCTHADHATVVDDSAAHLARARIVGARTVLIDSGEAHPDDAVDLVIAGIADLPGALASLP